MNPYYQFASKGFKVVVDTSEVDFSFFAILPLTDTVIDDITFPNMAPTYDGDDAIVGVTLKAGVMYHIYGDSVTLASGSAILFKR